MDGPAIITWNFTNWATILLMVAVGGVVIGLARSLLRNATAAQ